MPDYPIFKTLCAEFKLPIPVTEFKFHAQRRWRFDFCFPAKKIAVEIEGGAWSHGRHTRGSGFIGDMEKYNTAVKMGWRILRYTPQQLTSSQTYKDIQELINQ